MSLNDFEVVVSESIYIAFKMLQYSFLLVIILVSWFNNQISITMQVHVFMHLFCLCKSVWLSETHSVCLLSRGKEDTGYILNSITQFCLQAKTSHAHQEQKMSDKEIVALWGLMLDMITASVYVFSLSLYSSILIGLSVCLCVQKKACVQSQKECAYTNSWAQHEYISPSMLCAKVALRCYLP